MLWRRSTTGIVLAGLLAASCQQGPVAQVNIVIEVFNQTNIVGTLRWQGDGGSGSDPIRPCSEAGSARGLGPGTWQVTINDGSTSFTASVTAPATGIAYEAYGILPNGQIEHLYRLSDQQTAPPTPSGC